MTTGIVQILSASQTPTRPTHPLDPKTQEVTASHSVHSESYVGFTASHIQTPQRATLYPTLTTTTKMLRRWYCQKARTKRVDTLLNTQQFRISYTRLIGQGAQWTTVIDSRQSKTPIGNLTLPRVLRTPSDSWAYQKFLAPPPCGLLGLLAHLFW